MKVIGTKVSGSIYLVEASRTELIQLLGGGENAEKYFDKKAKYGNEIPISKAFNKALAINRMALNNQGYSSVRKILERMLEDLTPVEKLIVKMDKYIKGTT